MRRSVLLVAVAFVACDRHKSECEALQKVDPTLASATAQIDAIGVRDAKLAPLAGRYRAVIVAEKTKRDAMLVATRDMMPGLSVAADAGVETSLEQLGSRAAPLFECFIERSAECDEVRVVMDQCSRPDPGVSVSAHLGVCADALEAAKLATPARVTAAHDVATSIHSFAPQTATITIDAAEVVKRMMRALPAVREWQSAIDERRARSDDVRKACAPR
jgi:hypothetical protein